MESRDEIRDDLLPRLASHLSLELHAGHTVLELVAEGGANIIYLVRFVDPNFQQYDDQYVLRLRKDLPSTISTQQSIQDHKTRIAPLFSFDPEVLFDQSPCALSTATIDILNQRLHELEAANRRPLKRQHVYHPPHAVEPYGILMQNAGYGPGQLLEFKPKWLVQSPSAPKHARRCRTCALNRMRRAAGAAPGRGDAGFCPLDLLSPDRATLALALESIWKDDGISGFVDAFQTKVQPVLQHLQSLQQRYNQVGLAGFERQEQSLDVAMALRDCSVLLRVSVGDDNHGVSIEMVKFADLDLKDNQGGTAAKWAAMEQDLIQNWYSSDDSNVVSPRCALSRIQ